MVEKTIFGTMEDGREVSRYTLTNQNGVSAPFLDLGAIWSTMLVPDRNGEMADVLLGHETVADCQVSDGHLGEAVGRNANRIGGAAFTLNDKKYELTANDVRTTCTAAWIFTGTVSGRQNMRRALIRFRLHWKARTASGISGKCLDPCDLHADR